MNKYANLVGTNKIKDEYTKINTGFDGVETDIDALNDLVDALDSRVDTIITTPISGEAAAQEIVDARASAVKSKTFATLDARFEETEQDVESHMADIMTDADGAHGLKIESGSFSPYVYGSTTAGTNTYSLQAGSHYKIGKMAFVQGYIIMTAKDAAMAGGVLIGGLPFVAASGKTASFSIGEYRYITRAADKQLTARISGASNFIELRLGGINTSEGLPVSALNANTVLVFSGAYETV